MNDLVVVALLPERADVELLNRLLEEAAAVSVDGLGSDFAKGERLLAEIAAVMTRRAEIEASEPLRFASRSEVAKAVGYLAEVFSGGAQKRSEAFFAALTEDVIEASPSIGALRQAVKVLRQKRDFMPSIAEVLRAIASEMEVDRSARRALERLPNYVVSIKGMIEARRKKPAG